MKIIDLKSFKLYSSNEKSKLNDIINYINSEIDGRVCVTDYLYYTMALFKFLKDDIKVYAEIGTLWGGSAGIILQIANPDTELFCIDLFNGYYNKPTTANDWNKCSISINEQNHLEFVKINLNKHNVNKNKINYLKGSSYDDKTVSTFKSYNKKIDFLFIDGDHSEKGVVNDFMAYKDFMNSNGIICFDNYGGRAWPGVKKALDKINFMEYGFNMVDIYLGSSDGCLIIQKIE